MGTDIWVGLAVQRVQAGPGAQKDRVAQAAAAAAEVGVAVVARRVQGPVQQTRHGVLVADLAAAAALGARGAPLDAPWRHGRSGRPRRVVGGVGPELDAIRKAAQRLSFVSSQRRSCVACDTALVGLCRQSKGQSPQ